MIGQTIGNYRILARLGGGGMGVVYAAEDTRLGRRVAVKFLSEEMARHPQALERFEREARAASALNHPNIATVYDVGTHEGRPYLVMELVEGQPLDVKLRERRLDAATLIDWAIQTADALDAAHAKGIVHRDVKPANLLVTARGQVKVLDFGLAKVAERAAEGGGMSAGPTVDELLTSPGVAVGTVSYMSPEQARGEELDARSDIFSLGCVIYEMAAGWRAFEGKTLAVVFHAILQIEPTPLGKVNPSVPAKLEEIVAKALEKDRELRYQTAAELRADLKRLRRDLESGRSVATSVSASGAAAPAAPANSPGTASSATGISAPVLLPEEERPNIWRRMLRSARFQGVARLALVLAVVLAYRMLRTDHKPTSNPPSGTSESAGPAAPFSSFNVTRLTTTGNVYEAAISRDGKYLAYATFSGAHEFGLSLKQISTRSTVELLSPQKTALFSLAFSPDGSFLYYFSGTLGKTGSYYLIPSLGGAPRPIVSGVQSLVALSFDGNKIAYVGILPGEEKPALVVAGIGERPEPPHALLRNVEANTIDNLAWSPDGQTLALLESHPDPSGLNIRPVTLSVSGGTFQPLGSKRWRSASGGLVWLPDGSGLLFNATERTGALSQVWYASFPAGSARQLTSDLLGHINAISLTGDGKTFAGIQVDEVFNLWTASKGEDKSARQITSGGSDGVTGIAWTAEGGLVYDSDVTGHFKLWLTDARGAAPRQLTTGAGYEGRPTLCRGTGRIFYSSDASGPMQLWSVGLEDGRVRQETNGDTQFFDADCSADGSWFAGLTAPKGTSASYFSSGKLTRLDRENGRMRTLFEEDAHAPAISPDGKHVAFLYTPPPAPAAPPEVRIGIVSATGGPLEKSFEAPTLGFNIRWTPDGRSVVYTSGPNSENLWLQPVNGGKPKQLTHFPEGRIFNFAWSQDGKMLALARGNQSWDAVLFTSAH